MKHEEDNLLISVMNYIRMQYPKVLAIHCANERRTSPQAGALLKRKGVLAGVSDILIFTPKGNAKGYAIELKIKPNKTTPSQVEFLARLSDCGWDFAVCYDFDFAKKAIDDYMNRL